MILYSGMNPLLISYNNKYVLSVYSVALRFSRRVKFRFIIIQRQTANISLKDIKIFCDNEVALWFL